MSCIFPRTKENINNKMQYRWRKISAFIVILPYIIWSGFRSDNFGDTYAYRKAFFKAPQLSGISNYLNEFDKDKGFRILTVLIKNVIGNSDVMYFLILAAFQLLIIYYICRKYSCDYWFSIFIFVASTDYLSWMHNGIRQFTAVVVTLYAVIQMMEKRRILAVFLVLLAATFHGSAIIMLPVIFVIQGKAFNKKTLFCAVLCIIALFYIDRFTSLLETLLADTQYSDTISTMRTLDDDGTNPVRVLVYAIPTLMAVVGKRFVDAENDPIINIGINSAIIGIGIGIISTITSGILIGRLPVYFYLISNMIVLPWEIENLFEERSARLVKGIAIVFYILFFYYQMHYSWGIL